MSDQTKPANAPAGDQTPTAEELRMFLLRAQMAESDKRTAAKRKEQDEVSSFTEDFLRNQITEEEIAMVRRLVIDAVTNGQFEAMIYSFPSSLCTDSGRAINSSDPDWPSTLQGKARELYEKYETYARPRGYRLHAMIINFPGGIPGDVGFFLSWAPSL